MDLVFPPYDFLAVSFGAGLVLLLLGVAMFRQQLRVESASTWVVLALFGPLPSLLGVTAAALAGLDETAAIPSTGMAIVFGLVWVHYGLPKLLEDFQTESLSTSAVLAVLLGLGTMIGGVMTGFWTGGMFL